MTSAGGLCGCHDSALQTTVTTRLWVWTSKGPGVTGYGKAQPFHDAC
jgi:hypothetical protein